jgi:hypothetical protein
MNYKHKINPSYLWIFLSIPLTRTGTDLRGIIATADYLNHSIPKKTEIENAICFGLKWKIIRIKNDRFIITNKYKKLIGSIQSKNLSGSLRELKEKLNMTKMESDETIGRFKLPLKEYNLSLERYYKELR